jgi:type III secretion protein N (ATPase)
MSDAAVPAPAWPSVRLDTERVLGTLRASLEHVRPASRQGRVVQVAGTLVRVVGIEARLGDICELWCDGQPPMRAEVVRFDADSVLLAPYGPLGGLSTTARVSSTHRGCLIPVGDALRGRVVDGFGQPADGRGPILADARVPLEASPPDPLRRRPVERRFETRVRALDGMLACGEGQRLGIFAPPGAGKTTLMGTLARHADTDVNVIALIGERGREVGDFVHRVLGEQGLARSVVVAATSDRCAVERVKAAQVATTIAEWFRARGARVMLVMDSITRYARALRELGLAAGEPPVRRGFPPSVFAELPRLLERSGNADRGSITAFYTVLTDGPSEDDPIAEEVRAILDGHVVLSRELADAGRFPAVDVSASLSRAMPSVATRAHLRAASTARRWMAKYRDIELLLQVGEFKRGEDALADAAVDRMPRLRELLEQEPDDPTPMDHTLQSLLDLTEETDHA